MELSVILSLNSKYRANYVLGMEHGAQVMTGTRIIDARVMKISLLYIYIYIYKGATGFIIKSNDISAIVHVFHCKMAVLRVIIDSGGRNDCDKRECFILWLRHFWG